MTILDAIILGLIQGLTEFIPVSSSGHLLLTDLFTDVNGSFEFDVLINIGTLLALLIFFRVDIAKIIADITINKNYKLARNVIFSTIPAVVVGGFLTDTFKSNFIRSEFVVVTMLLLFGVLMVLISKLSIKNEIKDSAKLTPFKSAFVGVAQAVALIPGTSRSGATIVAGRLSRLTFDEAARYSFLIAIPIMFGALGRSLLDVETQSFLQDNLGSVVIGNIVSFLAGSAAIAFMIGYLKRHGLAIFGYYRIALALVLLLITVVD